LRVRAATVEDRAAVAELIHVSTNGYYSAHGMSTIFAGEPEQTTTLFCDVYEDLDSGCCLVAEHPGTSCLMGSCFYHPRETHYSLGIMNVHPSYFGKGVARQLLTAITDRADAAGLPIRLVSSALNLDSFSLYSKAGFVPHAIFQDTLIDVPVDGLGTPLDPRIRDATVDDLDAIVSLELSVAGISRGQDWAYFVENTRDIWQVSVSTDDRGELDGVLASVGHPGSRIVGPGAMKTEDAAVRLVDSQLDRHRGHTVLLLVPALARDLLGAVYSRGAKNCEIHFAQCRGERQAFNGVVIPSFMPETA